MSDILYTVWYRPPQMRFFGTAWRTIDVRLSLDKANELVTLYTPKWPAQTEFKILADGINPNSKEGNDK